MQIKKVLNSVGQIFRKYQNDFFRFFLEYNLFDTFSQQFCNLLVLMINLKKILSRLPQKHLRYEFLKISFLPLPLTSMVNLYLIFVENPHFRAILDHYKMF